MDILGFDRVIMQCREKADRKQASRSFERILIEIAFVAINTCFFLSRSIILPRDEIASRRLATRPINSLSDFDSQPDYIAITSKRLIIRVIYREKLFTLNGIRIMFIVIYIYYKLINAINHRCLINNSNHALKIPICYSLFKPALVTRGLFYLLLFYPTLF